VRSPLSVYIVVSQSGSVRVTKGKPNMYQDEIAFKLSMSLPDGFWNRTIPEVKLEVDQASVLFPEIPKDAVLLHVEEQ